MRGPSSKNAALRLILWTAFWVFLLDQATKFYVVHWLDLITIGKIETWPGVFELHMARNRGVNFGLFANHDPRWVLIGVAVVIVGFVLWWVPRENGGRWFNIAAGLLVGGAAGNVIDRVLYGWVADFLNVSCCGIENPYAFNLADIGIFVGALGLALLGGDRKGGTGSSGKRGNKTP